MLRRNYNAAIFLLLAIVASRASAQAQKTDTTEAHKKEVTVLKYVVPIYPAIAKTARIGGDVTLSFTVEKDGTVSNVHVVGGPPMLVQTSVDTIKQWKFQCLSCGYGKPFEHVFVFAFRVENTLPDTDRRIQLEAPDRLILTIGPPRAFETRQTVVAAI